MQLRLADPTEGRAQRGRPKGEVFVRVLSLCFRNRQQSDAGQTGDAPCWVSDEGKFHRI